MKKFFPSILTVVFICFSVLNGLAHPEKSSIPNKTALNSNTFVPISPNANNILYVNKNVSGGNESGNSWANALPQLADALKYAKEQDNYTNTEPLQIFVAKGTYKPMYSPEDGNFGNPDGRNNTFLMVKNVQLYGGFDPDNRVTDLTDERILPSLGGAGGGSFLSGNIGTANDVSDNTYHVVVSAGAVATALLDGFTIMSGNANSSGASNINQKNIGRNFGAGMHNYSSSPTLTNVTLSGNMANSDGGGMYNFSSSPSLTNVTLSGNTASNEGGGMYNRISSPTLTNTTLSENSADFDGGGMYNEDSSPNLSNVTLSENSADWLGGGMYNDGASPILTNVTISGNSATNGGGVHNPLGTGVFVNCTITGNTPNEIYAYGWTYWKNTIVWGNIDGTSFTASNSLIKGRNNTNNGNIDATDLTNTDIFTDAPNGDYSLQAISPVINLGSNTAYEAADDDPNNNSLQNDMDMAGNPRVYDEANGGIIDMGAYEFQGEPVTPINPNANNILYVNKNVSGSNESGNSWANAIPQLADALKYAKQQDNYTSGNPLKIFVAKGNYKPMYSPEDGPNNLTDQGKDNTFLMVKNVQLYGGFDPDNGIVDLTDERILPSSAGGGTTLSGYISGRVYHVVVSAGEVGAALLDGFTITGGNPLGSGTLTVNGKAISKLDGAGMFNKSSSPSLNNVSLSGNSTSSASNGGGMYNASSSPSLTNVTISGNYASKGGGIYNTNSSPNLTNVVLSDNSARYYGGGMYNNNSSSPSLTNVTLSYNGAVREGGAIYSESSTPSLTNSIVWNNIADLYENTGGVLGSATITYSLVQGVNNTANNGLDGTDANNAPQFTDAPNGDYSLQATSPVINLGSNTKYTNAGGDLQNDVDLAGNPRVYNGNPTTDIIDMGAYEFQGEPGILIQPDANNILYVNKNVSGGDETGDSWANALPQLADALKYAKEQDNYTSANPLQIFVAKGTYKPLYSPEDGNFGNPDGRNNTFLMVKNVQLYGGFDPDNGVTDLTDERILPSLGGAGGGSFLSGNIGATNDNSDNAYHVIVSAGAVGKALLDGFTIARGNSNNNGPESFIINTLNFLRSNGAGMYYQSSSPNLVNVTLKKNTALGNGAGAFIHNSSPTWTKVRLSENSANSGGGMVINSSSPNLTNVIVSGNTATVNGGGIFNSNTSSPTLTNVTLSGNSADFAGGGMYNIASSSPSLINTILWGNTAGAGAPGDGISNNANSTPTISYSLVQDFTDSGNNNLDGTDANNAPQFTDAPNGDYSLQATSPVINLGSNTKYTNASGDLQNDVDLAGNPRVYDEANGGVIDMGAYEFQGEPVTPINPNANNILYVDKNVSGGNETGDSWVNALPQLADALKYAKQQDNYTNANPLKIFVAKGTYKPMYSPEDGANFGTDQGRDNTFLMVKNVQVYGGFDPDNGVTDLTDERILPSLGGAGGGSFLSGDIGTANDVSDNTYHVVLSAGNAGEAELNGFTVTDGNANGTNSILVSTETIEGKKGGGVVLINSSPVLTNLNVINNNTSASGGGFFNKASSAVLSNLTIKGNTAAHGGGIGNNNSDVILINATLTGNKATAGGGGINNYSANPELINVTISGNLAGSEPNGGIRNLLSNPTIRNTVIYGNSSGIEDIGASSSDIANSLIQGVTDNSNGNISGSEDPIFTAPSSNTAPFTDGDYSLQETSPVINLGNNTAYTNVGGDLQNDVDLAGNPRVYNGNPTTDIIDMGAYEFQGEPVVPVTDYIWEDNAWTPTDPSGIATEHDNILVINGSTNLTADTDINNITVDAGATLNVEKVLTIAGDITNNGNLIFKSTATSDGELDEVPGTSTITGDVTVERYTSDNRAFRYVSSAVTTTDYILDNWQEGAHNTGTNYPGDNNNPNPNYGTHITGSLDGSNGLDATQSGNSSMFTLNVGAQAFDPISNTNNTKLNAGDPYMLYVRGDRSIDLTDNSSHGSTVLRATGELHTGPMTQSFSGVNNGEFVDLGNPYQSVVDLSIVIGNSTGINTDYAYVYDPTMGSMGAYVAVTLSDGSNSTGTGPDASEADQYLQPGQAVQVEATGGPVDINFAETDKAPGMHRETFSNDEPFAHITGRLFTAENHASGGSLHDGFSILFNDNFDNALNNRDAIKAFNFTENMGIGTPVNAYSIERRQLPAEGEEVALFNANYENQNYTLVFDVSEFANVRPYLIDTYTGEQTELEAGENVIDFTVDSSLPGSVATDRFYIHFGPSTLSVEDQTADYGIELYPNPARSGNGFYVTAGQFEGQNVNVSITDLLGKTVYSAQKRFADGKVNIQPISALGSGVYFVRLAQDGKTVNKRLVVN